MTTTFTAVAHHVVGQYSQVGKILVGAYRTGAQRLVAGANTRYVSFLKGRSLPLVNDAVKASLIDAQTRFVGLVDTGITTGTGRVEQAIDLVAGGVNGGLVRAAAAVDRVESALNTQALTTAGQYSLPVAQVSLAIANRAVEGTKRLSARVLGAEAQVEQVVAKAPRAVKRVARKSVATAKKAVRTVKARARA